MHCQVNSGVNQFWVESTFYAAATQVDEIDALLNEIEVEAWKLAKAKYMALLDGKTRSAIQTDGTTTQIVKAKLVAPSSFGHSVCSCMKKTTRADGINEIGLMHE